MVKGVAAVRQASADGHRELARKKRIHADPSPFAPRGIGSDGQGVGPGPRNEKNQNGWTPNGLGFPSEEGCEFPIVPLGHAGGLYHIIDSAGEFRSEPASFFNQAGLQDIFAACPNYPKWCHPRPGKKLAFEGDYIREMIFKACTVKGLFSPQDKLRGRGAWRLRGGQLIYHAGEELWVCDGARIKSLETGVHEGHLYPRLAPLPAPWEQPISPADNPAGVLLETFRKWNWERPDIDPVLLLGWLGVAFLGGAINWRSAVFLIGDKGTGKSTLQDALKDLFGDVLFQTADTSAAGIYQSMGHDTRPVAIDELEAEADGRKVKAVINLARAASSGAIGSRGSSGGESTQFQMRSAFLFSAINNPLQSSQDLSRVALLRLRELDPDQKRPPPVDVDTAGRMLIGRLLREWHRWPATFDAWRAALSKGGHKGRGQDTYGTLLAAADLLLGPELSAELGVETEDLNWWSEKMHAELLPEIEDAKPNWRNCIGHLLTARVDCWRNGARASVGKALADLEDAEKRAGGIGDPDYTRSHAARDLELTGLGLVHALEIPKDKREAAEIAADAGYILAVPNQSSQVAELFRGTFWQGTPGAGGPWKDAMRQAPEGVCVTHKSVNRVRVNGSQERCTLIVLKRYHEAPER